MDEALPRTMLIFAAGCLVLALVIFAAWHYRPSVALPEQNKNSRGASVAVSGLYVARAKLNDGPCQCSGSAVFPYGTRSYAYNYTLNISAAAGPGWHFVEWSCSGSGCYAGRNESASVRIVSNITETAIFYPNSSLIGGSGGSGNGSAGGGGGGAGGAGGYGGGTS